MPPSPTTARPQPTPKRRAVSVGSLRWLVLWLLLSAVYLSVDLPLRLLAGEGWPPGRAALLGLGAIPLVQVGALRFVQWMRRSARPRPGVEPEAGGPAGLPPASPVG